MDLQKAKNIYCIGIGGIGLSSLATLLYRQGKAVSGSDDGSASVVTKALRREGIKVSTGGTPPPLPKAIELVIRSVAIPLDHPQIVAANQREIPVLTYPEALGEFTADTQLITVSGTHGKSTTTAMIGEILVAAGLDPTVIVGSRVPSFDGNARLGQSRYVVLEADEYGRAFLHYHPRIAVVNNIEPDHLDVYAGLADLKKTFSQFIGNIAGDGWLIANADETNVIEVAKTATAQVRTFGLAGGDVRGEISKVERGSRFQVEGIGEIQLSIPGRHNVVNALAAIAVAITLEIKPEIIRQALEKFTGIWRRFERVGEYRGRPVISDYAHHPTAIRVTLQAAKEYFPDQRILTVFQPHQRHRTRALFQEFATELARAGRVVLTEIYDVLGREDSEDVSGAELAEAVRAQGGQVEFIPELAEVEKFLRKQKDTDVILIMGAGSIDNVARKLVTHS